MKHYSKSSTLALFIVVSVAFTGCDASYVNGYFAGKTTTQSADITGQGATPDASPTSGTSPVPSSSPTSVVSPVPSSSPTMSPSPSPSPSSCTETCTVPYGVGVKACGAADSTCSVTQCNPGYVVSNGMCVPMTSVNNFSCMSYEELVLNPTTNQLTTAAGGPIPAQNASGGGVCYYYPLVEVANPITGDSYLTGTTASSHDQDVASRDHDVDPGNPLDVWHPYSMAHVAVNLTFAGPRTLHLTGGMVTGTNFAVSDVQIDNFFLVGVYPQDTSLAPGNVLSYYSAWGTGDSPINGSVEGKSTSGIAFNPMGLPLTTDQTTSYGNGGSTPYSDAGLVTTSTYAMVPLNVEASGGTASVPEVSLTNYIMPAVSTTVDFRGIDCGADRYLSSVYLLIQ